MNRLFPFSSISPLALICASSIFLSPSDFISLSGSGQNVFAQSGSKATSTVSSEQTLSTEGVVGDVDKGRRAPTLTFSTKVAPDGSSATILADTQVINEDYKKYPISVDFYVNGRLFSKQFRSLELPAPLGVVVPKELAAIPFNYSIVATLIHPNRQYVTVAQGAVTLNDSKSALQCILTLPESENGVASSLAGTVPNSLNSDNTLNFTLTEGNSSAQISLVIAPSAASAIRDATGSALVKQSDPSSDATYSLKGTATASGPTVSEIKTTATEENVSLNCESVAVIMKPEENTEQDSSEDSDEDNLAAIANLGSNQGEETDNEGFQRADGMGPNGEPNFVPLDKADGVEVVN